ncbi:hypothetical protein [Desulfonema limicola]|nr:hypothetical protein [Desulfonema limicola]
MDMIATTITEHIFNQGEIKGEIKGKIKGKIELLENLFIEKVLTRKQFEKAVAPLRQQLKELME